MVCSKIKKFLLTEFKTGMGWYATKVERPFSQDKDKRIKKGSNLFLFDLYFLLHGILYY